MSVGFIWMIMEKLYVESLMFREDNLYFKYIIILEKLLIFYKLYKFIFIYEFIY